MESLVLELDKKGNVLQLLLLLFFCCCFFMFFFFLFVFFFMFFFFYVFFFFFFFFFFFCCCFFVLFVCFYRNSELMLPTLIQRYEKKFMFYPIQKRKANWNFIDCQMPHFMIVLIPYINLLNLSWIKMSVMRNMEPLTRLCRMDSSTFTILTGLFPHILDRSISNMSG